MTSLLLQSLFFPVPLSAKQLRHEHAIHSLLFDGKSCQSPAHHPLRKFYHNHLHGARTDSHFISTQVPQTLQS
ncbi:hypothetical protein B0T26DRAFT_734429 [Lasiosphaeria miniovina]|uniref:Uncharacterized protein n=1 Tax=Lasiosphaeria miniovina TaxID=1954250 RepID=A0AA39ZQC9_9PEZI|nr:uncharacterized protein B0T26DRAFT_734429 [Lasiosphaeria miniovina]KAK0701732.1 hypothetical protein B0T26DRAFT_734429 [Lasiosphaeria miniovina]